MFLSLFSLKKKKTFEIRYDTKKMVSIIYSIYENIRQINK